MTIERAIEILDPEHREHYDSIETVNEACRMGMAALEKQRPKKPLTECAPYVPLINYKCGSCGSLLAFNFDERDVVYYNGRFCKHCGQAIDWRDKDVAD